MSAIRKFLGQGPMRVITKIFDPCLFEPCSVIPIYVTRRHKSTAIDLNELLRSSRNNPFNINFLNESVLRHPSGKLRIGVQGAAFDRGQPKTGVAQGPRVIRSSGFMNILQDDIGHEVEDYGDIDLGILPREMSNDSDPSNDWWPMKLKHLSLVARASRAISDSTSRVLQDGRVCLTLGGDHSVGIGTLHGATSVYPDLAVLWVDAHADINTTLTTHSGNLHGMSLAFVIEELQSFMTRLPEFSWVTPRLRAKNLAYIGLRDVDYAERTVMEMFGISAFSMKDVDQLGIRQVTQMALEKICPGNKRPLHVSFDIDVLDDLEVSNTGTAVPGGLTLREGITLLEQVYQAGNMVSMDLVEVNPLLGSVHDERRTASLAKQLLINAFGYYRGGLSKGMSLPKP